MQMQEKKTVMEMKKLAKENNPKVLKIMAKDIIRIRQHQEKFIDLIVKMRAVSLQISAMASTHQLTESIKGATQAMRFMNKTMNMPMLNQMLMEFARQTEMMEMGSEMMGEAIDMAMDGEEMEEETDGVVNQILDEIGINLDQTMLNAPTSEKPPAKVETVDTDLEERLNKLGR
jgi:charged multivesicular body protein 2A